MTKTARTKTGAEIAEWETTDGLRLKYRAWRGGPDGGNIVFLHGIESHSEWFSACAREISKRGASVYAPDRRGSGLNEKDRGDSPGALRLVDDVVRFAESIGDSRTGVHLVALSWGGKLAIATDMLHPGLFKTITLIVPGIFPSVSPRIGAKLTIAFDALFRPSKPHEIPIKDEMFTSAAESLEYIAADPLRLRRVTARFYLESAKLDRFLKKRDRQWTAPTQLLLAEHDEIVDNRRLREMLESLRTEPKKVRMYAGLRHSLQFERPYAVAKDIVDWARVAPGV